MYNCTDRSINSTYQNQLNQQINLLLSNCKYTYYKIGWTYCINETQTINILKERGLQYTRNEVDQLNFFKALTFQQWFLLVQIIVFILASLYFLIFQRKKKLKTLIDGSIFYYLDFIDFKIIQRSTEIQQQDSENFSYLIHFIALIKYVKNICINKIEILILENHRGKHFYFYMMITAIFLSSPMIIWIQSFIIYKVKHNSIGQTIIGILYYIFGYIRMVKLLFMAQLVSSRREMIYINQQKHLGSDYTNKQIASIINYHLYKAQIIAIFYIVCYFLFFLSSSKTNSFYNSITDSTQNQTFQLVKVFMILFSLSLSYSRQDVSIIQNDKKIKMMNYFQRITNSSEHANSLVINGKQLEKYIQIEQDQQVSEEERVQLTLDEAEFRLEAMELQLKTDLKIIEKQKFQHLTKNKEKKQINFFLFLIYLMNLIIVLSMGFLVYMFYKKFANFEGTYKLDKNNNQCILEDDQISNFIFQLYFFQRYLQMFLDDLIEIFISYFFYYPITTQKRFLQTQAEFNKAEEKGQQYICSTHQL